MKYIGHTLFNDERYGGDSKGTTFTKYKQFVENCFKLLPRQALHAKTLGFTHPKTVNSCNLIRNCPKIFKAVLKNGKIMLPTNLAYSLIFLI